MTNKYLNPFKYYRAIQDSLIKFKQYKFPISKPTSKRIYIFSIPIHDNLGDQAIVYAQLDFLKKVASNYEIIMIFEGLHKSAIKSIKKYLTDQDIIAIHGGGNMGDVWQNYEVEREYIVAAFSNTKNKIISFPQSYNFTDTSKGVELKKSAIDIYSKSNNLILFARESLSLANMKKIFSTQNTVEFVPDIVLSLNKRDPQIIRRGVMSVLRSDRELLENESKTSILDYVKSNYSELKVSDTTAEYIPNIMSDRVRNKLLKSKWHEFSSSQLVITDRLHGMIFAYITGTPAIVFDNTNHKVRNSYTDWLNDVDYIHFADEYSIEELKKLISKYMNMQNFNGNPSKLVNENSYKKLIDVFNSDRS